MKQVVFTAALLLFISLTATLYASSDSAAQPQQVRDLPRTEPLPTPSTLPKVPETPAPAAEKARSYMGLAEAGLGGGGLFSKGARSKALLFGTQLGFTDQRHFDLTFAYRLKASFPEGRGHSLLHAWLLEARAFLWRGLYLGAGAGLALLELRLSPYQEFKTGATWLMKFGYCYDLNRHLGLYGELLALQYHTRALYTSVGAAGGLRVYF